MSRLVTLALLVALGAHAEEPTTPFHHDPAMNAPALEEAAQQALEEMASRLEIDLDPDALPDGAGTSIRAADDSDPPMRELLRDYYQTVPCRDEHSPIHCRRALDILASGGDRLAHYLIRQIEENEKAGFPNRFTYVRLLGRTESQVAYDYLHRRALLLADAVEAGDGELTIDLAEAVEGLGYTRMVPAADDAVTLMERFPQDRELRNRAVNAVDRVQSKHGPQLRAQAALLRARARQQGEPDDGDEGGPAGIQRRIDRAIETPGSIR